MPGCFGLHIDVRFDSLVVLPVLDAEFTDALDAIALVMDSAMWVTSWRNVVTVYRCRFSPIHFSAEVPCWLLQFGVATPCIFSLGVTLIGTH